MWSNPQETVDLVTFTEKILMENFIFCAVQGFLLKAFRGNFKMKVSTKCFVWGHSVQISDAVLFSGNPSDDE